MVVYHDGVVVGHVNVVGEIAGRSQGRHRQEAVRLAGAQPFEILAAHQSDARLPGTGQLLESGGNQSRLLFESDLDVSPLVGGDLVYLIHQFDPGGRGQQYPGQRYN